MTTDEKIDMLIERMDSVESRIQTFIQTVEPYLAEVLPMIERIESSPMFKMLVGGKKK